MIDLKEALAIYDRIVEKTHRDPKTRGCGSGNIRSMLESNYPGGKCADLNVGLARAEGRKAIKEPRTDLDGSNVRIGNFQFLNPIQVSENDSRRHGAHHGLQILNRLVYTRSWKKALPSWPQTSGDTNVYARWRGPL